MKLKLLLIFFACLTFYQSYSQDSKSTQETNQYNLKSKYNDQRIKQILSANRIYIELRCHPLIAPEIQDTLKHFYGGEIDTAKIKTNYKTDSTVVCIKDSYCWNLNNNLPQIGTYKLLKSLLRSKTN